MQCNQCRREIRFCPHCGAYLSAADGIVEVLAETYSALSGYQLADLTGWSKSAVYRELRKLTERGLVEKVGQRGGYMIGGAARRH